jgi:hypothetical protein
MPNSLKELLLGRGWAGKTITRADTVELLNPLIEEHIHINHRHRALLRSDPGEEIAAVVEGLQKTARADVGKLSEVVLSAGGVAYNGTDLEAEDFDTDASVEDQIAALIEKERAFRDAIAQQRDEIEHQMRTRAVLSVVQTNTEDRISALRRF